MMRRYVGILLLLFSLLQADNWELTKESDGVAVYTRNVEGSPFLAFKGVTVVEGSVDALVAILYDTPAAPAWLHQCRLAMTLEEVRFEENYVFQIYDLPFPVSDRQLILRSTLFFTENGVRVEMHEANTFCDEQQSDRCQKAKASDLIPIKRSRGHYLFIPQDEKRTKVIWQHHIEPGGSIPGWLANALVVDVPYNSLSDLRTLVKEEKYRSMTIEKLQRLWQKQYKAFH
ncbi:START domain-containing protein [Sulfurimonas sp. HSL3-7]|uniref:START domain-containing protein n=1 Tax=Sulfonitrofixus jiaomeiensis TaxID=3131938 RepID=UPI0031F8BCEC